ncbi:LacI family DNA-binding transcriptional regulator [Paenibacillus sp. GCM10027626]|uniref:LacI family DNA-binding transcriptional regulator n=1 Tax=Paenibacillus sp. GCM10027626 TaxID=3273411 RepID=UPI00362DCF80
MLGKLPNGQLDNRPSSIRFASNAPVLYPNLSFLEGGVLALPTLKDVAQHVGVSVSTVSRVVNNDTSRHINAETKTKVWQAVRELGYQPNETARKLVRNEKDAPRKATRQIGCIVAGAHLRDDHPYFSPILNGFNKKMIEAGYTIAFIHTAGELADEAALHRIGQEQRVDGVMIIGWIDQAIIDYLKQCQIAVIGISTTGDGIAVIDYDRISAAKAAVDHLLEQGHTRIGFIGGFGHTRKLDSEERYQGYKFALYEAGIPLSSQWIIDTNWVVDESYSQMTALLTSCKEDELPTAFFSASDMLAIPAMRAVIEQGKRIPEDIAFIAMDNIELSQYTSPPLSSVHVPKHEIGAVAAKTLFDQLQGNYPLTPKVLLPYELMIRQSSVFARNEQYARPGELSEAMERRS